MLIEAKDLVNGVSIVQVERADQVEYFHVELGTHDVIIAEGALSESFVDDDSRGIFHNAHEYPALYPEAVTRIARYCAPRLEQGYEVEAIRQRIALRAGLVLADKRIGQLRGQVDHASNNCIAGWAQNTDHPEAPVCLDIYAGGQLIGQVLANRYREDLARTGIGSGRYGFEFMSAGWTDFCARRCRCPSFARRRRTRSNHRSGRNDVCHKRPPKRARECSTRKLKFGDRAARDF